MSKLQRILCMVLSAILLLAWMPASLAEDRETAEPEVEVTFPDELIVGGGGSSSYGGSRYESSYDYDSGWSSDSWDSGYTDWDSDW